METRREEESESTIQEHGPGQWFSNWERQCISETEQREPSEDDVKQNREKLWQMFQNSATAVAQLYKERVCYQQGLSLWVPFQSAATAVTNLYKESVDVHQWSYELGIQTGHQRRNKDVLAWVKKRRRTIRREDLISFLCGKAPPLRGSRLPPNWQPSSDSVSAVETDLQAIALHSLSSAMADIGVRSSTPGSPTQVSGAGSNPGRCKNSLHDVDMNMFKAEEMALHLEENNGGGGAGRKRASVQCNDVLMGSPTQKRNRTI